MGLLHDVAVQICKQGEIAAYFDIRELILELGWLMDVLCTPHVYLP